MSRKKEQKSREQRAARRFLLQETRDKETMAEAGSPRGKETAKYYENNSYHG
jgi:hypothetical protein